MNLERLYEAFQKGKAVSLKLFNSEKTVVIGIKEMIGDSLIIAEPLTLYGDVLNNTRISLNDIETFTIFDILYSESPYPELRQIKRNVKSIRENILVMRENRDRR